MDKAKRSPILKEWLELADDMDDKGRDSIERLYHGRNSERHTSGAISPSTSTSAGRMPPGAEPLRITVPSSKRSGRMKVRP